MNSQTKRVRRVSRRYVAAEQPSENGQENDAPSTDDAEQATDDDDQTTQGDASSQGGGTSQGEVGDEDPFSDLRPYDWAAHFAGSLIVVATTLCRRSDGLCLLYRGRVNWLYGGYECGKSWLALMAIIETINAGRMAVVIDHDDDAGAWAERLRSVGVTERQIIGQFRYYHAPGLPFTDLRTATRNEAFAVWWAGVVALDVGVVVIEGVTQVYAIEGYDARGGSDIRTINSQIFKHIAERHPSRPAVVVTDHLSKPDYGLAGDRQVMPVDSGQKLPSVNGAGLRMVEIVKPHKPVDGQPNQGWCRIFVARDKAGGLGAARHEHPGKVQPPIADLFIDVAASGWVTLSLRPTERDDAVSYAVDQRDDHRLLSWVEGHPGKSQNEVVTGTGWGKSKALDVLNRCVGKGWVQAPPRTSNEPRNRSHEYTLTPNGGVVLKALHSLISGDFDDAD